MEALKVVVKFIVAPRRIVLKGIVTYAYISGSNPTLFPSLIMETNHYGSITTIIFISNPIYS
jgi:hypothetical protein